MESQSNAELIHFPLEHENSVQSESKDIPQYIGSSQCFSAKKNREQIIKISFGLLTFVMHLALHVM